MFTNIGSGERTLAFQLPPPFFKWVVRMKKGKAIWNIGLGHGSGELATCKVSRGPGMSSTANNRKQSI